MKAPVLISDLLRESRSPPIWCRKRWLVCSYPSETFV